MKIIHTSDWHLGQSFYDYDREAEQTDMLRQIIDIIADEQPQALLVSGDIFHTGNPSPKAIEMYNTALLNMHLACPDMHIVVTAGNHDSASRLVVNNQLWSYFKVTVIGNVAKNRDENRSPDYAKHIISVLDNDGKKAGYIAAVPHCYESNFPVDKPNVQRHDRSMQYFTGLLNEVAEQNTEKLPVVLMAHLTVEGCDTAGHSNIGGIDTRDVSIFGEIHKYDYVALGHIHSPQNITPKVRYSGTPVPVDFGEKHEHSISIVEVEAGKEPVISTRRIKNLVPLHDFPSQPQPFSEIQKLIADFDDDRECYLRILVKVDDSMTPLAETLIMEATKNKKCRVCKIQPFYDEIAKKERQKIKTMSRSELKSKTPLEIAEMFFEMKGIEFTERQRQMIQQATIIAEQKNKGDYQNEA